MQANSDGCSWGIRACDNADPPCSPYLLSWWLCAKDSYGSKFLPVVDTWRMTCIYEGIKVPFCQQRSRQIFRRQKRTANTAWKKNCVREDGGKQQNWLKLVWEWELTAQMHQQEDRRLQRACPLISEEEERSDEESHSNTILLLK